MIRLCFVCLGNICRSPTAEGVMKALLDRAGLADRVAVDSAGTGSWHVGEPPDSRARQIARSRGYDLVGRAQQFIADDFARFHHVIAMDRDNRRALTSLAPTAEARAKIALLRSFDPEVRGDGDVPDPYYGGPRGFEEVFDICERACRGLLDHLVAEHGIDRAGGA